MMTIGAIPQISTITNGRIPIYGTPALDSEREKVTWTRTRMRVTIATGDVEYGPLPEELAQGGSE